MIILAVDDDSEDFEFFSEAVREVDPTIVILKATNGIEALDILENQLLMPDYIFLDINMPLMDGKACLQFIKQDERFREIPVVMYSTTSNQTEISQYKMLGAHFLVKPNRLSHLVKSLGLFLGYNNDNGNSGFFFILM